MVPGPDAVSAGFKLSRCKNTVCDQNNTELTKLFQGGTDSKYFPADFKLFRVSVWCGTIESKDDDEKNIGERELVIWRFKLTMLSLCCALFTDKRKKIVELPH